MNNKQKNDKIAIQKKEYYSINKETILIKKKEYYKNKKVMISNYQKLYRIFNKEKIRNKDRKYYLNNIVKIKNNSKKYKRDRRKIDINYKLSENLRSRLYKIIKNIYKSGSAVKDLGCSINDLKIYLEKQFKPGMAWDNYGKWHLDHIKPLSSFNLTDRNQFLAACYYTNYQPLWAKENLIKYNK